jgi:hypothetical protein
MNYHKLSLIGKMAQMHFIENYMKKSALAPPNKGVKLYIVVNLLNHEKFRGRTSSATSYIMEYIIALMCSNSNACRTQQLAEIPTVFESD